MIHLQDYMLFLYIGFGVGLFLGFATFFFSWGMSLILNLFNKV